VDVEHGKGSVEDWWSWDRNGYSIADLLLTNWSQLRSEPKPMTLYYAIHSWQCELDMLTERVYEPG